MWTREEAAQLPGGLIGTAPYIALAWVYATVIDAHSHTFWMALGVLYGGRLAFWLLDVVGDTFAFVVYDKRRMTKDLIQYLSRHGFPRKRDMSTHAFDSYVTKVQENSAYPINLRMAARDLEATSNMIYEQAGLAAVRYDSVQRAALEAYAPTGETKGISEAERRRLMGYN